MIHRFAETMAVALVSIVSLWWFAVWTRPSNHSTTTAHSIGIATDWHRHAGIYRNSLRLQRNHRNSCPVPDASQRVYWWRDCFAAFSSVSVWM